MSIIFDIIFQLAGAVIKLIFGMIWVIIKHFWWLILIIIAIWLVNLYNKLKIVEGMDSNQDGTKRYSNPSKPTGYRVSSNSEGVPQSCSNCGHSCRSYTEGEDWYCQKHQVDVKGAYVCDEYYNVIFDYH